MADGRNLLTCALNLDCVACLQEGCFLVGLRTAHGYTEMCIRRDLLYSAPGEIDIVIENESVCGGGGVALGGSTFVTSTPKTPGESGLFDGTGQLFLVVALTALLTIVLVLLVGWFIVKRRMTTSLPGV